MVTDPPNRLTPLTVRQAVGFAVLAVVAFQIAYTVPAASFLIIFYLFGLYELTRLPSSKQASYVGLAVGLLVFGPQMGFLWTIFGPAAIALWFVLAFWIRMFLVLGRLVRLRFGRLATAILIPLMWTGLEYFRSELYYLRFTWFNAGYVFSDRLQWLPMKFLGVYGFGFGLMATISFLALLPPRRRLAVGSVLTIGLAILVNLPVHPPQTPTASDAPFVVAGLQLEFPTEPEVIFKLDQLARAHPEVQLFVLSEYTFNDALPERIKAWCRKRGKYLIVGAKDLLPRDQFYNTAFVIGPTGEVLFKQAKSVPIQFFKDGLPAAQQALWESPWGRIGIGICYDLSYTRVTDELVRLGAQALIVPTMDVAIWGRHQHELHARVAPIRAAEYGIPIFRLASSGISQSVNRQGEVLDTAPFPGDSVPLVARLSLRQLGTRPWDRIIAPVAVAVTAGLVLIFVTDAFRESRTRRREKREKQPGSINKPAPQPLA